MDASFLADLVCVLGVATLASRSGLLQARMTNSDERKVEIAKSARDLTLSPHFNRSLLTAADVSTGYSRFNRPQSALQKVFVEPMRLDEIPDRG
jgi:hypothetical protein